MLNFQSGQEIQAITGYAFIYQSSEKKNIENASIITRARFRQLSSVEIEYYVANQAVLTWSAAFSPAYDAGMALLASAEGNLTAFTHGLPVDLLVNFINQHL